MSRGMDMPRSAKAASPARAMREEAKKMALGRLPLCVESSHSTASWPAGHEAVEWLLSTHKGNLPSAIFFASSRMARAGLAAFADRGMSIPRDIAVATYDIFEEMVDIRPRLTTIGVEPGELG